MNANVFERQKGGKGSYPTPTPSPTTEPPILQLVRQYEETVISERKKQEQQRPSPTSQQILKILQPPKPASYPPPQYIRHQDLQTRPGSSSGLRRATSPPSISPTIKVIENRIGSDLTLKAMGGSDVTTRKACVLNEQGLFGKTAENVYEIKFLYQIYVNSSTLLSVIRADIMESLDRAVATQMLPNFFDCTRQIRRGLQDSSRTGTVIGLSSLRPDELVVGCKCFDCIETNDGYNKFLTSSVFFPTLKNSGLCGRICLRYSLLRCARLC